MEIMATIANNHNQKELRFYAPNEQQQSANSTATLAGGARSPFQREVREWQRIDPDTGALLTGRLEADRWINGPLNKYGKISDSQNISQPNGTQQTQRKQLEVLQTCTAAGGAMQVIRSQTVQTTSSRWSTSSASPLLLSASTSPIPQQLQQTNRNKNNNNKHNNKHSFSKTAHNSPTVNAKTNNTTTSASSLTPFIASTLLTNGFNHKPHHLDQLQQCPHSLANGIGSRHRNWPDLTEKMSTLHICDDDHNSEHDHANNYIVLQQSSDEQPSDDNDIDRDDNSLIENNNNKYDDDDRHHRYLLNKRNNLKNVNSTKRRKFTVFTNKDNTGNHYDQPHQVSDHESNLHHHQQHNNHNNNLSRDSCSVSCSNNNQLFLLDTAPSLKLSNLMKSSSSLSTSSSNSTTASQATTTTNTTSMNTHKNMATNNISLHAIVGNNNNAKTATTTSSTPSPTLAATTTRTSWQQPSIYRQNNHSHSHNNHIHLMKSRVGDTNNCCGSSSSDESRSYAGKTETDLRHLQRQSTNQPYQQQQQIHFKQNDRLTPTHSSHTCHRVDLESFRHYNNENTTNNNNDTDDDGLRLSSRHLRRQQIPNESTTNSMQRSRSISTDDLSTEWDTQGIDGEEPAEWRRVSKLRRSFQSSTKTNQQFNSPTTSRRPLDLPTNSVSVAKIRAELENGRRLNTVMRNNHVDLAALSSILNGSGDKGNKSLLTPKRNSFLTAESLKEIRGKLKKLSDESLYKEDFLLSQQNKDTSPELTHIISDQTKIKRNCENTAGGYTVTNKTEEVNSKHTTNSLESRLKYRETNSSDWHIRRKSYGFEKMSPPEKATLRMDASTDSGLGRSGELQNWSPTSDATANNRTVVHFGGTAKITAVPIVQRRYRTQKSYEPEQNSAEVDSAISKRHSIAVDESQYVRDNPRQTTQIHLNGLYEPANYAKFINATSEAATNADRGQQKRVEFSKTEVHFATESGRVNIVETDSKPPPTNNFRRRRSRSSSVGPLQSLVNSATTAISVSSPSPVPSVVAMPITLFGDDNSKKKTIAATTVAYRAPLMVSPEPKDSAINVTVTIPSSNETCDYTESSRSSYASTSGVDTTDCDTDEMTSLRGILKNKPAKPKPYVLGENIEKPDELWGVQLKPVGNQTKHERVFKSESPPLLTSLPQKTVAERIQELGSAALSQSNAFSTKINVSLGNTSAATNNWEETGLIINTKRRPTVQELLMHDLKEHQKILDEGLKSTTLIIKTMRSATEFDEAMRRLSMASIEATVVKPTPIFSSNHYHESTQPPFDYMEPKFKEITNVYKASSFSSTSSWSSVASSRKYSQDSRKSSTDSGTSFLRKDSMPRLSFLGNEQIPVSQQLNRLRLIYDAATISQDEDSADEEVKSYFREQVESDSGGGTQDSSSYEDDPMLEHSNSWSRLKARKTIWKIDADKIVERSFKKTFDKTELPKSNIMSIKLHSPQAENEVQPAPPIAKPRTVTTIPEPQPSKLNTATSVNQALLQSSLPTKDSLKIIKEARGARQLRGHELSYFGVPVSTSKDEKTKSKYTSNSNFISSPKRSLPLRKRNEDNWQLENDKPDLLKHNTIEVKPAERTSLKKKAELEEDDEHLYENIANDITPVFKVKVNTSPERYDRKTDLQRDAMILCEMNQNADQSLRELSDEAAVKDRRRRSLQRHNPKPLETIDEKSTAERVNDMCIAVKISRGTHASEAKKNSRHSTPSPTSAKSNSRERTSSQSSVESCPRARSRSLSSEKEYETTKSKPSRNIQMVKHKAPKPPQARSSSLDSQRSVHSQYSSGEDQQRKLITGSFRREDRSRVKTKRITSSANSATQDKHRDNKAARPPTQQHQRNNHNYHCDANRLLGTTHSTSHRERVECKHDNALEMTARQQYRHHNSSTAGLQRSTAATSSGRRRKDDSQKIIHSASTNSGQAICESHNKHEQTSSKRATRSLRNDEANSSQRSSLHCLECGDKSKGKSSRSAKGHSNRSTSFHHHDRSTNPDKHLNTKDYKTKPANPENTTSSKNVQHHQQQSQMAPKERHERQNRKSKRDEDHTEHVHGLKSAIIQRTTKLRETSRNRKEKNK